MKKKFQVAGALFGATAVILGAFGAHILKEKLSIGELEIYEKGVYYQVFHSLAILFSASMIGSVQGKSHFGKASLLFCFGIIFFSGSLYLLACKELLGITQLTKIIGPITPLGGLCLIAGWIMLAVQFMIGKTEH